MVYITQELSDPVVLEDEQEVGLFEWLSDVGFVGDKSPYPLVELSDSAFIGENTRIRPPVKLSETVLVQEDIEATAQQVLNLIGLLSFLEDPKGDIE